MRKPRPQDVLFGILALIVVVLLTFHIRVAVLALVGAFACGSLYVFAGMMPSRTESLGHRLFGSVFLSIVLASLVLILPGTFGVAIDSRHMEKIVLAIAASIPVMAICFEVLRTPRVTQAILRGLLRCLGQR